MSPNDSLQFHVGTTASAQHMTTEAGCGDDDFTYSVFLCTDCGVNKNRHI